VKHRESTADSKRDILNVLTSRCHSIDVARERHTLIVSRVQSIAGLLAGLTVVWIVIDSLTMSWPLWGVLGIERVIAAITFLMLALHRFTAGTAKAAYCAAAALVCIPTIFFLSTYAAFWHFDYFEYSAFVTTAYFYAPFLIAVGLSIFPLTVLESALLATPTFAAMVLSILLWPESLGFTSALATLWRLALISGIASVAGASQLRFLMSLVEQATHDAMTKTMTRNAGEQLINWQFAIDERKSSPLAVLFIDIDKFKSINDQFGHEAGDTVLQKAAQSIHASLRRQDILVRWGGEEFLVILPETDSAGAETLLARIASAGLGLRPDGMPVSASVGIAERISDKAPDWTKLVELADQRMYAAKGAGRNCYVSGGDKMGCFIAENTVCTASQVVDEGLLQGGTAKLAATDRAAA